jgi:selenocysteine lyase/cysteine desulfurase
MNKNCLYLGTIRAGLVFHVKDLIGSKVISEKEHALVMKAWDAWSRNDNITLLGHPPSVESPRVAIISFVISHGGGKGLFLHWNYVAALLNDLFGIQVRGGCVCAGPYAIRLLGIYMCIIL